MKKLVLLAVILFFSMNLGTSVAQKYSKAISADPVSLAWGFLNATYENKISASNSFSIFGTYYSFSGWTAYGIGGSYRWYFDLNDGKKPLQGLSAGPLAAFGFWSFSGSGFTIYDDAVSIALGGELAYKWVFSGGFMVEPILRATFNVTDISGLAYRNAGIGVNLGYAW